jgi:translation initiation factor IF-3
VRVVHGEMQLGVMNTHEAIKLAKARGMDLVEVSANARPPVCKIVDYGKYKYDQKKLQKEHPKKTHRLKEVKFRVGVAEHDYNIKVTRAEGFLMYGDKTRVQLMFRGRQMAHKEIGFQLMDRVKEDLAGVGHVDMSPRLAGRFISMMVSPLPEHLRKPKFKVHEDPPEDFEDEEDEDDEVVELSDEERAMLEDDGDSDGDEEEGEEKEEPLKPHEHQLPDIEDVIAIAEGDTGRPKSKRKG